MKTKVQACFPVKLLVNPAELLQKKWIANKTDPPVLSLNPVCCLSGAVHGESDASAEIGHTVEGKQEVDHQCWPHSDVSSLVYSVGVFRLLLRFDPSVRTSSCPLWITLGLSSPQGSKVIGWDFTGESRSCKTLSKIHLVSWVCFGVLKVFVVVFWQEVLQVSELWRMVSSSTQRDDSETGESSPGGHLWRRELLHLFRL